jgi:hypothetical protein
MSTVDVIVFAALGLAILWMLAAFPIARVVIKESFTKLRITTYYSVTNDGVVRISYDDTGSAPLVR